MCGFTGFVDRSGTASADNSAIAMRMRDCLTQRGPDDAGVWSSEDHGVTLGHRRLSILDLSAQGHQPMHSATGRYVIAYNGEIYNYRDLRNQLEQAGGTPAAGWRGHSDTEVLLAAVESWGVRLTLERLNGMFALALVDNQERVVHLARDRMGEKPLYYGWMGSTWMFGSQLSGLRAHPAWRGRIDRDALAGYLRYGYVRGPRSIYEGIAKLPPAGHLTLSLEAQPGEPGTLASYWSLADAAVRGGAAPFRGSAG